MQNPYLHGQDDAAVPQTMRRRVTINENPPVFVSFGKGFPHQIRFRKRVNFWPFQFMAEANYTRQPRGFQYGCSCRDSVLGGGIHLDVAHRSIEYRKEVSMAHLPLSNLIVVGRCRYTGMLQGRPQLSPSWSVHMELGRGAATFAGDGIAVQQEVPLTRRLAFQVCGSVHFPMPSVTYSPETGGQQFRLGEGTYELKLDQLNPIIRL